MVLKKQNEEGMILMAIGDYERAAQMAPTEHNYQILKPGKREFELAGQAIRDGKIVVVPTFTYTF